LRFAVRVTARLFPLPRRPVGRQPLFQSTVVFLHESIFMNWLSHLREVGSLLANASLLFCNLHGFKSTVPFICVIKCHPFFLWHVVQR
jgi:hypothetical protein